MSDGRAPKTGTFITKYRSNRRRKSYGRSRGAAGVLLQKSGLLANIPKDTPKGEGSLSLKPATNSSNVERTGRCRERNYRIENDSYLQMWGYKPAQNKTLGSPVEHSGHQEDKRLFNAKRVKPKDTETRKNKLENTAKWRKRQIKRVDEGKKEQLPATESSLGARGVIRVVRARGRL
jgi:hypothetical protein